MGSQKAQGATSGTSASEVNRNSSAGIATHREKADRPCSTVFPRNPVFTASQPKAMSAKTGATIAMTWFKL